MPDSTTAPNKKGRRQRSSSWSCTSWLKTNYGGLLDEMIRDRLEVGIRNQRLSEKMQLDPNLNLEKTKKMAHQQAVSDQSRELKKEEGATVDMVSTRGKKSNWKTQLTLQDKSVDIKIDMAAEATIISENTFRSLKGIKLTKAKKRICGPSQQFLPALGQFTGKLTLKEQSVCSTIYVVKGFKTNLLGLPAITALNIVARVNTIDEGSIESQKGIVLCKYPDLFRGLGNLGEA